MINYFIHKEYKEYYKNTRGYEITLRVLIMSK